MPFPLDHAEVERIRALEIARGNFPDVMETEEAAIMCRRSPKALERSNAPRSRIKGEGKGKRYRTVWLKSQLLAWLKHHSTYDAEKSLRKAG